MLLPGSSDTFTVSVEANSGLDHTYQWQKNETDISGATLDTYTISDITQNDEGVYRCAVSNTDGHVVSSAASLIVCKSATFNSV